MTTPIPQRTRARRAPARPHGGRARGYRLEGDLVTIRSIRAVDLPLIQVWWEEVEANRLDGGDDEGPSVQFREGFANRITLGRERSWFLVEKRAEAGVPPLPVGYLIYRTYPNEPGGAEVAMRLSRPFWGRKLGTESFALFLSHLFGRLRFDHLWLTVYVFNPRAIKLYERAGFLTEDTYLDEKGLEMFKMTLARSDWERAQTRGRPCES